MSASNTGALMATARFVLKTLPGIDRPAIAAVMPTLNGHVLVLDMGANVDCTAEHLLQFGVMGAMLVSAVEHKTNVSVGLLNIGEEDIKGNEVVKRAAELLREPPELLRQRGRRRHLQGHHRCGGMRQLRRQRHPQGIRGAGQDDRNHPANRVQAQLADPDRGCVTMPVMKAFKHRLDPRRYNGATLLGLKGVVVKSHGSADRFAFENAIETASDEVRKRSALLTRSTAATGGSLTYSRILGRAVTCPRVSSPTPISKLVDTNDHRRAHRYP